MTSRLSRPRTASAQELLPLEDIVGDTIRLRGGECRAVLQAGSVNFALKSESEQAAILAGYRRFLNGLPYPLQILVRVVPTDVEAYLRGLEQHAPGHDGDMLRRLARDHETFVRRIARERTLLDRRFYVIVPVGRDGASGRRSLEWPWHRPAARERDRLDLVAARRKLAFRCAEMSQGLAAFGVAARRLDGEELASLWRASVAGTATAPLGGSLRPSPVAISTPRTEVAHA